MKTIIGLVGQQASGKGTVAAYLAERYGAKKLRFSDPLFDILKRLSVPATRDKLIIASEKVREGFGETILAEAIAADIAGSDADMIVVDGVRREGDIATLRTMPGFHLLAVSTGPEARYERTKLRGEKAGEATLSYEDFLKLETRSTEVSASEVEKTAEATLMNDGTTEELYLQVEGFLRTIGVPPAS